MRLELEAAAGGARGGGGGGGARVSGGARASLAFVGAHLPAHEGERPRRAREAACRQILAGCRALGGATRRLDLSVQAHHVFWCGDLNFRLEPERLPPLADPARPPAGAVSYTHLTLPTTPYV